MANTMKVKPVYFETRSGSRVVRTFANDAAGPFTSTLYVNNGDTATLRSATAKTESGARKQAARLLS